MKQQNFKLHNTAMGTSIAVRVMFVLCGVALLAFFGWFGISICTLLGGLI